MAKLHIFSDAFRISFFAFHISPIIEVYGSNYNISCLNGGTALHTVSKFYLAAHLKTKKAMAL